MRDLEIVKILGEGTIKCLTALISPTAPFLSLVGPVIDTIKELKDSRGSSNHISFSDINDICKIVVPDFSAQHRGIVSVATDICLKDADFLNNPYEPKEYSKRLANRYIKEYSNHYGEAELESIRKYLPLTLEFVIPEMEKYFENDVEFRIKWRTDINSHIIKIEERQDVQEIRLADHETRIRHQEERTQMLSPKISELSNSYFSRWASSLFLDKDKPLSQVYQLPNYQTIDYWGDEDEDEQEEKYDDLDVQLKDTIFNCNNLKTRMLVVLGHPGSGKSTLITYLLNSFLLDVERTVRVYRFSGFESINWNNDPENIPQLMLNDMGLAQSDLSDSIVILDGLDEVQMHNNHEEFLNYLYQQWASSKQIKRFSLIVTCRRNRIDCIKDLQMRYVLLSSLNEKQIGQFASAYWEKDLSEFDTKQMGLITRINNSSRQLRDVLGIPLILYMALALEIGFSDETGLCDIYEHIFSVENNKNSIYYRRYDKTHPITSVEAEKIQEFSKEVARLIWEFSPAEGTVDKEKYEPVAKEIASDNEDGLRELLIGQYFMEGKDGCQLLFVHRSMYEYFIALSIYDSIKELVSSPSDPVALYSNVPFSGGNCDLSTFANIFGLQNLIDYPEIQDFLLHMLQNNRLGNQIWWKAFFSGFLSNGLSNAANCRPKGGPTGLKEELNRFYNLIWLTREQLEACGERVPHLLSDDLDESIYLRIPYQGKKDLRGVFLQGIELMGYNFVEAELEDANLSEGVLNRADFSEANLERVDLHSAEIEQALFSFASLCGANFRNAHLKDAQFENADLRYADFSGADLCGADFSYSDLTGAVFSGAKLMNASFLEVVIDKNDFNGANMTSATLTRLHLKNSSFVNTDFTDAALEHVEVSPATSMSNANFENSDLSYSDFQHIDLSFSNFENAIMREMYLCGSNLNGANLRGAELSNSNLENALLSDAQLKNAILDNSSLKFVNLENADLRGASLRYADLTYAKILKTKVNSDTLDTIICDSTDRSRWTLDDSLDFGSDDEERFVIASINENDFMEIDDNMYISKYELEWYEKQCCEDNVLYPDSDIY